MTIVDMCVHMDCQGCERKIRKALQKVEGVEQVEIDLERQKVTVTGWVDQNKALKAVRKTGRKAVIWPYGYSNGNTYTSQQYYNNQQDHPALAQNSMSYRDANNSSSTPSHNYYKHGGGYDNSREHGNYGYRDQPQPAPLMYQARVGQRTDILAGYSNGNTNTSQQYYNNQQYHPALAQNSMSYRDANNSSSTPSHNYYKHGYGSGYDNSREHGNYGYHYQPQPAPLMYRARVGQRTEDMFSDENPNACSIM